VDEANVFVPVAPAPALQIALEANLKLVRDWLDQKDYGSAAETTQGMLILAQLHGTQSTQPAWRERVARLRATLTRLAAASKEKDAAGCQKAVKDCEALLAELSRNFPKGEQAAERNFKPAGALRTWMLLLEGTYTDAKTAANIKELEAFACTIAEGANALQHERGDVRWRMFAREVREAALAAAAKAKAGELEPARQALKMVYPRCEACHQNYKK
jgi:cytochrome c556